MHQSRASQPSSTRESDNLSGNVSQQTVTRHRASYYESSHESSPPPRENGSSPSLRGSATNARPYAASAHPLDQRNLTRKTRTSFGTPGLSPGAPAVLGRRRSIVNTAPGFATRDYKHSSLPHSSNGNYASSPFQEHPALARGDGEAPQTFHAEDTESTVSTTAPSTVWDELDDLKSRIRKLELTGKLPKSSNAAMANSFSERPPTATTTMTTISTSPKRLQMETMPPEGSTVEGQGTVTAHPILYSALAKIKPVINKNLFKALEATASDALTLAAMTGGTGSQGPSQISASTIGNSNAVDRQLRRKADSMCRSLTELCIALADDRSEAEASSIATRPSSRNAIPPVQRSEANRQDMRSFRAASEDPEFTSSSKIMSRLEARRRTSLLGSRPLIHKNSPQEALTPVPSFNPLAGRLDRVSSVNLRNHASQEEVDSTISRRPPSRATTEISQMRPSPQTQASREYTSQHPMPSLAQLSPSMQSTLPTRKSYFSSSPQTPITPSVQPGSKRYLERSTPPSSADSARLAEARQRRILSLGQHTSAGQSKIGIPSGRLRKPDSE